MPPTAAEVKPRGSPPISGCGSKLIRMERVAAPDVPLSEPRLNQVARCSEPPWVKLSGTT